MGFRCVGLALFWVLSGCGAASLPARYPDRGLLVPADEHQVVVSVPAGLSDEVLPIDGAWRWGLGTGLAWEAPVMFAYAPVAPERPPFAVRLGIPGFGIRKDQAPQDDPRLPPEDRTRGVTVVRLGLAGWLPVSNAHVLVPTGHVDRVLIAGRDASKFDLRLTWLTAVGRSFSFAPAVRLSEGLADDFDGRPRTHRLMLGHVGWDGGVPCSLVAWHAASFVDLGIGAALGLDLNHPTLEEVEADVAINLEFHWD